MQRKVTIICFTLAMFVLVSFVAVQGFRTFRKGVHRKSDIAVNLVSPAKVDKVMVFFNCHPQLINPSNYARVPLDTKTGNPALHIESAKTKRTFLRDGFIITITDKSEVGRITSAMELKVKEPCQCAHTDTIAFYANGQEELMTFCDHCLGRYHMPAKLWELLVEYNREVLQSEGGNNAKAVPAELEKTRAK